jgi:hypothetical protein
MPYTVTAPAICVRDRGGKLRHYYEGAVVEWMPADKATQLTGWGMVQEISPDEAAGIAAADASQFTADGRPKKTAPVEVWRAYRVKHGYTDSNGDHCEVSAEGAKEFTKPELVDLD